MISPDAVNGLLELGGAAFISLSVYRIRQHRMVRGVHWGTVLFFSGVGLWNIYSYPAIGQPLSFLGGCCVVAANTLWLAHIWYYIRKERSARARQRDTSTQGQALSKVDLARRAGGI